MTDTDSTRDFLLARACGQLFALPAAAVTEAVAPRPVTPLPFVPPFVEGLVNVNERVLPQVDLRALLFPDSPPATRSIDEVLVVETPRAACALRVDRIVGRQGVAADRLQPISAGEDTGPMLFDSQFDLDGETALVLDLARLGAAIVVRENPAGQRGLLGRLPQDGGDARRNDEFPCVVLRVQGERYALALDHALEILDVAPATPIPGAPVLVEGVSVVRDDVLLVLSLPALLRRGVMGPDARQIVVIERDGVRYGLRVDGVDGIVAFDPERLRPVEDESSEVTAILVHEGEVHGLLTPRSLLPDARHATLAPFVPGTRHQAEVRAVARRAVLQITLGREYYAIPLAAVRRIARYKAPEVLDAGSDSLVSGAVNIDGAIVPVVDLSAHLAIPETSEAGAWVIVGDGHAEWAIPVHAAHDILEIPVTDIEELGQRQRGFVTAVANVGQRLVSLLSLAPLTGNVEAGA